MLPESSAKSRQSRPLPIHIRPICRRYENYQTFNEIAIKIRDQDTANRRESSHLSSQELMQTHAGLAFHCRCSSGPIAMRSIHAAREIAPTDRSARKQRKKTQPFFPPRNHHARNGVELQHFACRDASSTQQSRE